MSDQDNFQRWRKLVASGRSKQVLRELQNATAQGPLLSKVVQQRARTRALQERIILGIISYDEERQTEDEIRQDLLALIDALENGAADNPELAREIANIRITGDVRNAAINSTLHAQQIHFGDRTIVQQAKREIGRFLTPAPFVPEVFVGREKLLNNLRETLKDPASQVVTLLHGEGGIGKSSLAAAYYHRYARDYDHVGWLFTESGIEAALLRLAPGLNVTFSAKDQGQEAMLDQTLRALANLRGNCLLVLDNVNDQADLADSFHLLAGLPNFRVVLTSRLGDFPNTNVFPVAALDATAAKELFTTRYRALTAVEATLFSDVFTAVGGNTLVLELLAKNLKRVNALRPTKYLLSDLVADLQEKGIFGLRESKAISTQYGGKLQRAEVGPIVTAMYDLEALPEEELFLLALFSALPADKIPFVHLEALAVKLEDAEVPLLNLAARGWVEWDESNASFRCSPVVQEVVRAKRTLTNAEIAVIVAPLITALDITEQAHAPLSDRAPFIRYITTINPWAAIDHDQYFLLNERVGDYYVTTGNLIAAQQTYVQGYITMRQFWERERLPGQVFYLAVIFQKNGLVSYLLGDLQSTIYQLGNAIKILEGMLTTNPDSELILEQLAVCHENEARCYREQLQWEQAITTLKKSILLFEKLVTREPENLQYSKLLGAAHSNLGGTCFDAGQTDKMEAPYTKAAQIFERLVLTHPDNLDLQHSLSIAYEGLASVNSAAGQFTAAKQFLLRRLALAKQLVAVDSDNFNFRQNELQTITHLGSLMNEMGDFGESHTYCKQALTLAQALREDWPDTPQAMESIIISMTDYGRSLRLVNEEQQAVDYFLQGIKLNEALIQKAPEQPSYQKRLAILHSNLGHTDIAPKKKEKHLITAQDIFQKLLEQTPGDDELQRRIAWVGRQLNLLRDKGG